MKMSLELCRLCLSKNNLKPIFPDIDQSEKYTTVLALTTGLNIQFNDGLPQQICEVCTDAVNGFLKFRNQALISESELFKLGFRRIETSTNEENKEEKNDNFDDISTDCYNFENFKIEVELDRISQNAEENEKPIESTDLKKVPPKKNNKKEMRRICLSLVEGEFDPNRPIKCKLCKKSLNKWKSFMNHAKKHLGTDMEIEYDRNKHDDDEIREPTEESTNPVATEETVEKKKKSRKEMRQLYLSLVEGELVPTGPVKCKICKKSLNKWNSFINHARKHLGFKFVCEFCGKSFGSSNQLKRHCRSFHGMERDLKCKLCNYLALDTAQLRVHERRVHTGERPFVCDTCAAAYFSRKCLLQHIESHRTIASVQCDKCPMTFKSKRHLAKHVYGTHSDKRRERRRERRQAAVKKDTAQLE